MTDAYSSVHLAGYVLLAMGNYLYREGPELFVMSTAYFAIFVPKSVRTVLSAEIASAETRNAPASRINLSTLALANPDPSELSFLAGAFLTGLLFGAGFFFFAIFIINPSLIK